MLGGPKDSLSGLPSSIAVMFLSGTPSPGPTWCSVNINVQYFICGCSGWGDGSPSRYYDEQVYIGKEHK